MEYRFFYPIDEHVMNTKWKTKSRVEHRTDIYFILFPISNSSDNFHLENGLKLRNKKSIELKTRLKRSADGQEYWLKTVLSNRTINIRNMESILQVLKSSNKTKLAEQLESREPIILCYATKFRQQEILSADIVREITGLHLKFIRNNDQTQIGPDLFFETVCIERSSQNEIDEKIIKKFPEEYQNISINPMGYPEFLFLQYQQLINGQTD